MEEQAEYKVQDDSIKDRVSQSAVERVVTLPAPFYEDSRVTIYHGDCEEIMPHLEAVDLLLTDPPYGIGADKKNAHSCIRDSADWKEADWDEKPPHPSLIEMMRSKAKWQIIWGGNYFDLPPTQCYLIWNKLTRNFSLADAEIAWTNFKKSIRIFDHARSESGGRVHPTQKPLKLMSWCIQQAPDDVATILDPFMGSGTTLVAAKSRGKRAIGIDRDLEYCQAAVERLRQETLF